MRYAGDNPLSLHLILCRETSADSDHRAVVDCPSYGSAATSHLVQWKLGLYRPITTMKPSGTHSNSSVSSVGCCEILANPVLPHSGHRRPSFHVSATRT